MITHRLITPRPDMKEAGKTHARLFTPEILCFLSADGNWWRSETALHWSDDECRDFSASFDQERNALYRHSVGVE